MKFSTLEELKVRQWDVFGRLFESVRRQVGQNWPVNRTMSDPISGVSQLMKLSVSASEAVQVMRMQRLWWCLPAVVLCVADGLLTLWGQPVAYWSGGFAVVREGNPL